MNSAFRLCLAACAQEAGLTLEPACIDQFEAYYTELLQWNAKFNLTTITAPEDAAIKHFLDSLLLCKYVPLAGLLLDIGTGAGFPGLPLKIARPELQIVLVESIRKKTSFLKQVIRLLKLEGIEVYNGRIEDFDRCGCFDYAVSRAFSELGLFCRLAAPFITPDGRLLAMKGGERSGRATGQVEQVIGFSIIGKHSYALPRHKGERSLIILQKCFT